MDIVILQPDASHAETLSEIGARLFTDAFFHINHPDDHNEYLESHYTPEIQRRELDDPSISMWMALDQHTQAAVAFCQLKDDRHDHDDFIDDPEALQLSRLYVDKHYMRQGIATRLLAACIAKAKQMGKRTIWLSVWGSNQPALAFYRRHGFRKVGAHRFQVGKTTFGANDIMVKILES